MRQKNVGLDKLQSKIQRFKKIFLETVQEIHSAELPLAASSLSYTTLLSVIPLIAVSFSIFKTFGGLEKMLPLIEAFIFENLAEGSDQKTLETLRNFVGNIHARALGIGGFLGLIITSMSMLSSIEKSINRVWKAPMNRSWYQRITSYWFFITLGPLALSFAIGFATTLQSPITRFLPSGLGLMIILGFTFYGMYQWIPHRKVHPKAALFGALWSTIMWGFTKMLYGIYLQKVVSYNKIYGSLGAIPIFMLWIYIAWLVVLSGAALSCTIHKRRFNESS